MQLASKQEYETRHLPTIEFIRFNGNPEFWPEFIDNFYQNVHLKMTFSINREIARLVGLLDGDAKKVTQSIGLGGLFCASMLKTSKRDFSYPLTFATLYIRRLSEKPQTNGSDRTALREFFQQLKMNTTWSISLGYETLLKLTKTWLPYNLVKNFSKLRDCNLTDSKMNLIVFENWFERKLNLLVGSIASQDTSSRYEWKPALHKLQPLKIPSCDFKYSGKSVLKLYIFADASS